jgi:hypothetical protein
MARRPRLGFAKVRACGSITPHAAQELKRIEVATGTGVARVLEDWAEKYGTEIRKILTPEELAAFEDARLDKAAYIKARLRAERNAEPFSDLKDLKAA